VSGQLVVDAARESGHRHVDLCADWHDIPKLLRDDIGRGDVILTLGAGDIYRLAEELVGEEAA
jgi:UDP-N-acetylmuramate--alanine ligase